MLPISFARVLQREGRQSLATAKANLDAFAAHGEVLIELADEPTRDVVASALRLLGAECRPEPAALSDSLSSEAGTLGPAWTAEVGERLEALERGDVELVS